MPCGGNNITATNQTQDGTFSLAGTNSCGDDHCTTAATSVTHTWGVGGANTGVVFSGFTLAATAVASTANDSLPNLGIKGISMQHMAQPRGWVG